MSSINVIGGFQISSAQPADAKTILPLSASLSAIDPITRYNGMRVYCQDTNQEFQLIGGVDNSNWVLLNNGSGSLSASYAITASYVPNLYPQTYQVSASWASASLSASYVPNLYPQTTQISASWASQSLSAINATSASYIQGGNVIGTVLSASYAKNAQLIIDFDWHLVRNSNTIIQTTQNFVPNTVLLARNGILCTADYLTTEYDYYESGSNQLQLHFTMSGDTKMMAVYTLQQ